MCQAFTEEERMEYKEKWRKLKADWQTDVAEWEERNANNPKMTAESLQENVGNSQEGRLLLMRYYSFWITEKMCYQYSNTDAFQV